jgi:hypothetical protein
MQCEFLLNFSILPDFIMHGLGINGLERVDSDLAGNSFFEKQILLFDVSLLLDSVQTQNLLRFNLELVFRAG